MEKSIRIELIKLIVIKLHFIVVIKLHFIVVFPLANMQFVLSDNCYNYLKNYRSG